MPRPKSTDTEATRQAIAAVAEDLFRTVGYHKTTLADIASWSCPC
jgi:AcrR family transcriptional regulator